MDISIFLAQALGLYFVIAGVAMLVRPKAITRLTEVLGSRDAIYVSGFYALLIGVPLVLIHNVWDGSWRVLITIIAWLALLKGVVRIYFPDRAVQWVSSIVENRSILQGLIWVMVGLGLYFLYVGFSAA